MMTKQDRLGLICHGCRHLQVTHERTRRWGCRKFGFRSAEIPARVVYAETGMPCAYREESAAVARRS